MSKASVHALPSIPRPEIALREASEALAAICAMIDDGELDPRAATTKALFDQAKGGLAISVDAAIDFKRGLDAEEKRCDVATKAFKARKRMIKEMRTAFDDGLIACMTERPDLPFQGSVEGFSLRNNPPSVELVWGDDKKLTEEMIDEYGVSLEYVRPKVVYEIDKAAEKNAEPIAAPSS